jgi:hypothetical protein
MSLCVFLSSFIGTHSYSRVIVGRSPLLLLPAVHHQLYLLILLSRVAYTFANTPISGSFSKIPPRHLQAAKVHLQSCPSTIQAAKNQLWRLFHADDTLDKYTMKRQERLFRIFISLVLLSLSKAILLYSSLSLKSLIEKSALNKNTRDLATASLTSAYGLFFGVGASRVLSGAVGLMCDLYLSAAINSAAETLPKVSNSPNRNHPNN